MVEAGHVTSAAASDWSQLCQLCCLRFNKPRSFFAAMAFGNCGYAFPAAMGAKVGSHFYIEDIFVLLSAEK